MCDECGLKNKKEYQWALDNITNFFDYHIDIVMEMLELIEEYELRHMEEEDEKI